MDEKALFRIIVRVLKRGAISTADWDDMNELMGKKPEYIFCTMADCEEMPESEKRKHGVKLSERNKIIDEYLGSLSSEQIRGLFGDDIVSSEDQEVAITRQEKILFISILKDGFAKHKMEFCKIMHKPSCQYLMFGSDGKLHKDLYFYEQCDNPDGEAYYKGTPLVYWNKML